jgi:hypothetical protein
LIATQKSGRFGYAAVVVFGPIHCSALGRSAFDQILAGRWSCGVYTGLKIMRLFNTAHGLDKNASIAMPGENLLAAIECYTEWPRSIFRARMERI